MALVRCRSLLCSVVAPPFMYGTRHPEITGLIRVNEDISPIARTVLFEKYLKFFPSIIPEHVDLVEVVTDNCMGLQANYIQSGAGILLKSSVTVIGISVPCGIGFGFEGIGEFNSRKNFHSIQARTVVQTRIEEWLQPMGGLGIVHVPDGDIREMQAPLLRMEKSALNPFENAKMEQVSPKETCELFSHYCVFENASPTYALVDGDRVIAGASVRTLRGIHVLTNPFVSTDCEPGKERLAFQTLSLLLAKELGLNPTSIRFTSNDPMMRSLYPDASIATSYAAMCVGVAPPIEAALTRRPWTSIPISS